MEIIINQALHDVVKEYSDKNNLTFNESIEKLVGVGYRCEKYGGVFKVNKPADEEKITPTDTKTSEAAKTPENNNNDNPDTPKSETKKPGGVKINYNK